MTKSETFIAIVALVLGVMTIGEKRLYAQWQGDSNVQHFNGKVGIGNSIPTGKLHLGNGTSDIDLKLDSENAKLRLLSYTAADNLWIQTGKTWESGSTSDLKFTGINGLPLHMIIKSNGNIGIGTTNPLEKLQVSGSLYLSKSNPYIYWLSNHLNLKSRENVIPVVAIRGSESYSSRLDMYKSGDTERTVIIHTEGRSYFNGGNVGIGTTNPEEKLHVEGTIRAREIKVQAQTADFVFEKDYQLKPLEEVHQFVTKNKHLPDIPSAKEMEADGVDIAELNKLLLQKVEELTLYTIQQQKLLEKQQAEINNLKEAILTK